MANNHYRCVRLSPISSATTIAITATLFMLVLVPGSTSQRATAFAPAVVSAHDPASADPVHSPAFATGAHPSGSSESFAAQKTPPEATAVPAPHGGSSTTAQSLRVATGHSDNDVHFQSAPSSSSARAGNSTLHVEAREESDNRIADPRLEVSTAPTTVTAAGSNEPTDAADAADALTATPHVQPTAAVTPLSSSTAGRFVSRSGFAAVTAQQPTSSSSVIINVEQKPTTVSTNSSAPTASSVVATIVSHNMTETNQTSQFFQDATRRSIQYVNAGQQQNLPQDSSQSKGSTVATAMSKKAVPDGLGGGRINMGTSTTEHNISSDMFAPTQNTNPDSEGGTSNHSDESITDAPDETSTEPLSTVADTTEDTDETTTYMKVEEDVATGPAYNASIPYAADEEEEAAHPCARECVAGAPPMRCHYRFEVTGYYAMSKACYDCPLSRGDCDLPHCIPADGVPRGLVVVNRQMPGPAVEVCLGDRIIVDLHNGLVAETTSVHWHGHHQRGTPYMDGVPHVTQCPVPPMTTFRYAFTADTPGTHFWHSHTGHQRADGAFGALVVRVPREADAHAALWDRDERAHTLLVLDWGAAGGAERFLAHHHASGPNKPTALLVNGRGRVPPSPLTPAMPTVTPPTAAPPETNASLPIPAAEFVVKQGLRYRFRLINAGFLNCPIELSVDDHDMLVISSDGSDIRPVAAASLVTYAGERFDFVLEANRSVGAYWIRMRGLLDCGEHFTAVHQAAILRYEGATDAEPPGELSYVAAHRPGHQVNSLNVGTGRSGSSVIPELDALAPDDESLKEEPDYRFYVAYDFYALDNPHFHTAPHYGFFNVTKPEQRTYTPQFNHISMKLPSVPMLPQHEQLDQRQFCNASSVEGQGCKERYCECAHVIQVPLDSVLEIVLIDEGVTYNANHPFHLHGYAFRVVGMERLGESTSLEEVKQLDAQGLLKRKLHRAPLKDTCTVPDGGYTILRVRASNPGYWLFHCHIEFHVEIGMALVFKIGEHSDFPPVPKGFPRCGDWTPDDDLDVETAPEDTRRNGSEDAGEDTSANEVANVESEVAPSGAPQRSPLHDTPPPASRRNTATAPMLSTTVLLLASLAMIFEHLRSR